MPASPELLTSFDFPKTLTTSMYEKYQAASIPLVERYKSADDTLVPIRYFAICLWAAVKAGIIKNWKSTLVPVMNESTCENADNVPVGLVEWMGQEVAAYIDEQKAIPKVSLWRLVVLWTEKARLRRNWRKPSGSNGSSASPAPATTPTRTSAN